MHPPPPKFVHLIHSLFILFYFLFFSFVTTKKTFYMFLFLIFFFIRTKSINYKTLQTYFVEIISVNLTDEIFWVDKIGEPLFVRFIYLFFNKLFRVSKQYKKNAIYIFRKKKKEGRKIINKDRPTIKIKWA